MTKIESLKIALAEIDALADSSPEKKSAAQAVAEIERERDFLLHEIDARLKVAVAKVDALDAEAEPRMRQATDLAASVVAKFGKPLDELRKIVEAIG